METTDFDSLPSDKQHSIVTPVIEDWGLLPYAEAQERQLIYVDQISKSERSPTVVICSHPPVVTKGRATQAEDIFSWEGEVFEVARGGRATYHGPEQIVIYPLIDLSGFQRDIRKHLRVLEQAVMEVLMELQMPAQTREGETGIWVGDRKICSFGVACRHWVTYHGLALYVEPSKTAYSGIHPCGYKTETMVSVGELSPLPFHREELAKKMAQRITSFYQC